LGAVQWDNTIMCLMGRPKARNTSLLLFWRLGWRICFSLSPSQPHIGLPHFYFKIIC